MNRFAMFFAGLLLMCSMSGCCLMHGYGGGYGAGYPGFGGGGGCGSCGGCNTGCGMAPGGYQGAYAPGGPTAFAPMGTQTAFAPGFGAQYPQTALIDPLPTY
jgi:hypothetical protein